MNYVYLTIDVVTDQCKVDPFSVFSENYASNFIEAPDEVTFDWRLENGDWIAPVIPKPNIALENKTRAEQLLQETDWTASDSIANPTFSNPYLTNQNEFLLYRSQVRTIAINPPETPVLFPEMPKKIWSA